MHSFGRFLVGLFLALLIVDGALRIVEATPLWRVLPVVEPIIGQPDPEFGFDSTPGAQGIWITEHRSIVRINSLGLRDVERQIAKPAGTFRIGLTGDSMVEAMQVEQAATFAALAERRLRQEGYEVELINLGIAGPNPVRQLWRLNKRGYRLGLDLIVANSSVESFLSGLLLDDSDNPAYVSAGNGELRIGYAFRERFSQRHADDLLGRAFIALVQNSPLLRMLYLRSRQPLPALLGLTAAAAPAAQLQPAALDGSQTSCTRAAAALAPMLGFWRDHQPALEWAATARFLEDLARGARARDAAVVYLVREIPLPRSDCAAASSARAELVGEMEREFARRGIRMIDWSAAVAALVGGPSALPGLHGFGLRRGAGHLNYDGHRAWADALSALVREELASRGKLAPARN
jgi:hypothetical protein